MCAGWNTAVYMLGMNTKKRDAGGKVNEIPYYVDCSPISELFSLPAFFFSLHSF